MILTTPGGDAPLANGYRYVLLPSEIVFFPSSGPATGGNTITITSSSFHTLKWVTFRLPNGEKIDAEITRKDLEGGIIEVTAPDSHGYIGEAFIDIVMAGGTVTAPFAYRYEDIVRR